MTIAVSYLCTCDAPINARGTKILYSFLLVVAFYRWVLNLPVNRAVGNNDVWRLQQAWFSFSFITTLAVFEAIRARVTGKDKSRESTGAGQKTSWSEIPNVLFFLRCCSVSSWHSFVSCRDTTSRLLGPQLPRAVASIGRHVDVLDCKPGCRAC